MDEGTLGYFNHILSAHLNELERSIRVLLSTDDERGDGRDPMDEVDVAANRSAWEAMVRMQHRSRKAAFEIRGALQRIRHGDFGTCVECGDSIGMERLKAHPMTTVCIQCKRKAEVFQRLKVA
jgi:DnaK suppressor protein